MQKKFKRILTSEPFIAFLYRFARAYAWTLRITVENEKEWMDYVKNGGPVLICGWHQQFFSAIRHVQNYKIFNPSIMISQSSDGEIVAGVVKRAGWHPVRGSSSKDGRKALKELVARLRKTKLAGHIVDGPRGPSGRVKAGAIRLAHAADAVIVPFSVSAENGWHFNSWDKFLLPKPFSRVVLRFGKMLKFDKTKDQESFEKQRRQLEEIMLPGLKI
ncbi:MAG: lysophospholipid acyltransferase family protein [Proteobacteria bacterium]|nr:lysophospholipid acyltransferase family protein [Pseudomonadota bacterium]